MKEDKFSPFTEDFEMPQGYLGRDVKKGVSYVSLERRRPVRNGDRDAGNVHANESHDGVSSGGKNEEDYSK